MRFHLHTSRIYVRHSRLVCVNIGPETILICNINNLSVNSVCITETIAAMNLVWIYTLLLFPLLIAIVILNL